MNYFVTAIGTDSGKTLVAAIVCEALEADYWKPVQAGPPHDSAWVKTMLTNSRSIVHPEGYTLNMPASPHASAKAEGITIRVESLTLPPSRNTLIIEGAGGVLVPLNDQDFVIDIASKFDLSIILVSNYYLGSINHTLLTFEALKARKLNIAGIIFNGERNEETRQIILQHTELRCLLDIEPEGRITPTIVAKYAKTLYENWKPGSAQH
jgi:dethiobiotin synthetase